MAEEKSNTPTDTKSGGGKGDSEESGEEVGGGEGTAGSLTSPDAIINFIIAGIFDAIELIPVVGDVSDIIAGIYFCLWMIATGKKGWGKFIIAIVLEAIPIVSDITPFISLAGMVFGVKLPTSWIGFVYAVLSST